MSCLQGQKQYFANVALKVNMKLGGIKCGDDLLTRFHPVIGPPMPSSHLLDPKNMEWLLTMPTMLVGIDVTHPDRNSLEHTPSIAAVVASVDDKFAQYPASMSIHKSKEEVSYSSSYSIS